MKIVDFCQLHPAEVIILVDVRPPRTLDVAYMNSLDSLGADFLCVAYSPGGSVRVSPEVVGATIKRELGKDIVFNLVTRDANKVGIQTQLLGARELGLENVVVMKGDPPIYPDSSPRLKKVKSVHDFTPTELIRSILEMNQGNDFRGNRIRPSTDFCIGAAINLNGNLRSEAELVRDKVQAGAQFFITQPVFESSKIKELEREYSHLTSDHFPDEVFWGVQIPTIDGEVFGRLPTETRLELDQGKDRLQIAVDVIKELLGAGVRKFYILPQKSLKGHGDYRSVQELLSFCRM